MPIIRVTRGHIDENSKSKQDESASFCGRDLNNQNSVQLMCPVKCAPDATAQRKAEVQFYRS